MDTSGNVDPTPAIHRWTLGAGPDTAITSGPEEAVQETTATFTFASNLSGVRFECAIDEMVENLFFLPCGTGGPWTFSDLLFGEHELLVRAVDAAGNVDPIPAEWSWEIGGVPPPVLITSGPDLTTSDRSARFEFEAEGINLIYLCSLDGSEPSPCLPGKAYNGLPLGEHVFEVQVMTDQFSVSDAYVSTWEWRVIDSTGLDTTITMGPPDPTAGINPEAGGEADVPFAFSASDPRATFECAVDGELFQPCEQPFIASGLGLGKHMFRVRAVVVDPTNSNIVNVDPTPARWHFTVVEAPETTIDIGPEGEIIIGPARFVFSSTLAGSTFECAIDFGPFFLCSSPYLASGLEDGEHTFEVRAVSPYGIRDITPEEWSWTVDQGLPETTILSGPKQPTTTSTAAAFDFASDEPAEFECSLDGGLFEGCDPGPIVPGQPVIDHMMVEVPLGTHTLRVRAVDESDFFDPTPASYTWKVVDAPQTSIVSGPLDPTSETSASISFSSSNPSARRFECKLDGGAYQTCDSRRCESVQRTSESAGTWSPSARWTPTATPTCRRPCTAGRSRRRPRRPRRRR